MLTPDQVKPHLLHEDRWVRSAAFDYFYESWSRDPEIAGLLLAAHETWYRPGEFPRLDPLHRFVVDEPTAERVLTALAATPSRIAALQLNWCVAALPLALVEKNGPDLEALPAVNEETRAQLRLRRELPGSRTRPSGGTSWTSRAGPGCAAGPTGSRWAASGR